MFLILPCEVAVKSVVPTIKALMTKQLMDGQGFNQEQVAEILGISQSAVSKYSRKIRGHTVDIEDVKEIRPLINGMIAVLLEGTYHDERLLDLFCQTCILIRKSSLMCVFCAKSDSKIKLGECRFCINSGSDRDGGFV